MRATEVNIKEVKIELSNGNDIEIIYIPNQTQVLREGRRYKFVFNIDGVNIEEL